MFSETSETHKKVSKERERFELHAKRLAGAHLSGWTLQQRAIFVWKNQWDDDGRTKRCKYETRTQRKKKRNLIRKTTKSTPNSIQRPVRPVFRCSFSLLFFFSPTGQPNDTFDIKTHRVCCMYNSLLLSCSWLSMEWESQNEQSNRPFSIASDSLLLFFRVSQLFFCFASLALCKEEVDGGETSWSAVKTIPKIEKLLPYRWLSVLAHSALSSSSRKK